MAKITNDQFDADWIKEQYNKYKSDCDKYHMSVNIIDFTHRCLEKMREEANR